MSNVIWLLAGIMIGGLFVTYTTPKSEKNEEQDVVN